MSEDRPRKSWREIDQNKDKSAHRRDERPEWGSGPRRQRSQKSYRSKLDQLFDSGKIGKLLDANESDDPSNKPEDASRLKLLHNIKNAEGRDPLNKAVEAYLAKYALPEDFDVLCRMLECRNPSRQFDVMEHLEGLLESEQPKRSRALLGQLKMIRDTSDERDAIDLAKRLIDKLD